MKWADEFAKEANAQDLICVVTNQVHGWPETMMVHGKTTQGG